MKNFGAVTDIKELIVGEKYYLVTALAKRSWIEEFIFLGMSKSLPDFFSNVKSRKGTLVVTDNSLNDCNVIKNSYNDHYVFFNEDDAKAYLDFCIKSHKKENYLR
jgi:hypothetical protein